MTENKGVTVYTAKAGGRDWHRDGVKIHVFDGHLFVLDGTAQTIAIYAPGRWHNAEYSEGTGE